MEERGRKPVLDDAKKREIVAIVTVGCSRRVAARYVGCAPSTITYTAQRDEHFAAELHKAAQAAEISNLQNIQNAAKKEQYWRAAAWVLERCHPDQYAARGAECVSLDQVRQLLGELAQIIVEEVHVPIYRKRVLKRLDSLIRGLCFLNEKTNKKTKTKTSDEISP